MTALLQQTAFVLWGSPVTWVELLGDASGAACVWLVARQSLWNWPVGLLNNGLFFVLFLGSRLYGDAVLQLVFGALALYGWWSWSGARRVDLPLRVTRTPRAEWLVLAPLAALALGGAAYVLARHTDSPVPLWDAGVLVGSLAATYGQARKRLESWWLWIAVDVVSVPLYVSRKLYPTAALYVLFAGLCVMGLREWTRALPRPSPR